MGMRKVGAGQSRLLFETFRFDRRSACDWQKRSSIDASVFLIYGPLRGVQHVQRSFKQDLREVVLLLYSSSVKFIQSLDGENNHVETMIRNIAMH